MGILVAGDLLALWERGWPLHSIDRALAVLAEALPERHADELADLPLGQRDALLLRARGETLGDRIEAQDVCPACGERVEVQLSCQALASSGTPGEAPQGRWTLEHDGCKVTLRPLDSRDAAAAARCADLESARATLLGLAIVAARCAGRDVSADELPTAVIAAAAASVADNDPGAEIEFRLRCPSCGHAWDDTLDVASFVWAEIADRAQRVLLDVDALARAYGWREPDILALSEERRAAYLALAGS
ncbi:hypothetical protein BH20CHL5_BH20CHL5_01130 [soil metagenome]